MACCGKLICGGCVHAFQSRATKQEHDLCPFCRTLAPTSDEEIIKRLKKRMELNDAQAIQLFFSPTSVRSPTKKYIGGGSEGF